MRHLAIVARAFGGTGGLEGATRGLVGALAEHGYRVDLLSIGRRSGPATRLGAITALRLPVPVRPRTLRLLATVLAVRWYARRGPWDLVQSHERALGQDVYRAGEGCHRAYLSARGGRRPRAVFHRLTLGLERRLFRTTPRIVANSARGRDEIARLYGVGAERLSCVYNGVDLDRFHPDRRRARRSTARAELGLGPGVAAVLFLGSGFARKGLDLAIAAFARLRPANSRLLVAGRGDPAPYQRQAAMAGAAERVLWLGERSDPETCYAAADALVLPARYEPFGNVHLEALASGLPVVASRADGAAECVSEGRSGWVVDAGSPDAVARALEDLLGRPAGALAAAARADAEPFTYARQVAGFEAIYGGLWGAARRQL